MTNWYTRFGKRIGDIVLSVLALGVLSPLFLVTAAAVRIEDRGPALFRQRRAGCNGRTFLLYKFRSMGVEARDLPSAVAGQLRVTRVGQVIRRSNIDELPQLFNILKGEMSIVGPRPALITQVELLKLRDENGASSVRPGLTGLAQICSYDGMPADEKARLDGEYAARVSAAGDISIVLRTFGYLTRRPPVY